MGSAAPNRSVDLLLHAASVVFWDFDGVIKDSVAAKSAGFERLFVPYGSEIAQRVRRHHEANGGLSRYEKIPLYLQWAGEPVTDSRVAEFCEKLSQLVLQEVIDSAWVPGVREYLHAHHERQRFVLVTATPQQEIQYILQVLGIAAYFRAVFGAPTPKATGIGAVLQSLRCAPEQALMIGDSQADLSAANANNVSFVLRRTAENRFLQERYQGPVFEQLNI